VGGTFKPDFGFTDDTLDFNDTKQTGWDRILDLIKTNPGDEKSNNALKMGKGKKEIFD
jgi:hypothetical protein